MKLQDRVAIVTGAATGIGRACAQRFHDEGARVVVADIDEAAAGAAAKAIGARAEARRLDAMNYGEVAALVQDTVRRHARLDILVNNVGFSVPGLLKDVTPEQWDRLIAGNLSTCFYGLKAALPVMLAAKRGAIVNLTSAAGLGGAPMMAPYGAAKAGVISLTQSAAVEHAKSGVRVNCVAPGPTATDSLKTWLATLPGGRAEYEKTLASGRFIEPEEIAAGVFFLASDEASMVNGVVLRVDGAATAKVANMESPE